MEVKKNAPISCWKRFRFGCDPREGVFAYPLSNNLRHLRIKNASGKGILARR